MRLTESNFYNNNPVYKNPVYKKLIQEGLLFSDSFWIGAYLYMMKALDEFYVWHKHSEMADAINKLHQEGKTTAFIDNKDEFIKGLNLFEVTHSYLDELCKLSEWEDYQSIIDFDNLYKLLRGDFVWDKYSAALDDAGYIPDYPTTIPDTLAGKTPNTLASEIPDDTDDDFLAGINI